MPKTTATEASVESYIAALPDAQRRADCATLREMMERATGHPARMWGPTIVGFDRYAYTYDSGHSGEMCITGFSSRKPDLSIYLAPDAPGQAALLAKLGKHKMGKSCLSVRRLTDVDLDVLRQLIADTVAETRRRHPSSASLPGAELRAE
ncbi:DUF1801 domain containing protein [Lysobacter dokdonensis DS-58]|uniref:DUF1801 domain containing protein n=1 Tax=Lysobacter dokdonensis DS-58 TaxID=1300345 RepID=A0A0A2WY17_9GAMM|nr:DUF1801 domain-containing protein [Lysobacter dokdonensis]KGQ17934.1 DUF1801 domain containing protein [Lysobacter dokdonensis DS-58]